MVRARIMKNLLYILEDTQKKSIKKGKFEQQAAMRRLLIDDNNALWKKYNIPKPTMKEAWLAVETFNRQLS